MRFGTYLISKLLILWDFWIFLMLEYYIGMQGFYKFHQISLLCDHQELACTPKDPPRRVDMNEMSLICFCNQNDWVIDKNVWKPALLDLLQNRICAFISWYISDFAIFVIFLSNRPLIRPRPSKPPLWP